MSTAFEPGYEDYCDRLLSGATGHEDDDDAEERRWLESLETTNTNGEDTMEHSGVFLGGGRPMTVDEIDALPAPAGRIRRHQCAEARAAIGALDSDALVYLVSELLMQIDDERATTVILGRVCSLPDEDIGCVASQALQLLGNKCQLARARAEVARAEQRSAETAIVAALGQHAVVFGGEVGP
jgi:hypothetical protein